MRAIVVVCCWLLATYGQAVLPSRYLALEAHADSIPDHLRLDLGGTAAYLNNCSTDAERAYIAFYYVATTVAYDIPAMRRNLIGQDVDPMEVLRNGKSVCHGYANLYRAILAEWGIESALVPGFARNSLRFRPSAEEPPGHSWVAVLYDGSWHLMDPTWAAGTVQHNQFRPDYRRGLFDTRPAVLMVTHFPEDAQWQLLEEPIQLATYNGFPLMYYALPLMDFEPKVWQLPQGRAVTLELRAPAGQRFIAVFQQGASFEPFQENESGQYTVTVVPTGPLLEVYGNPDPTATNFEQVLGYQLVR